MVRTEALFFLVLGLSFILLLNWRNCIKVAFFLVVIEGAIRKWFLPSVSEFVYFAKDIVVLIAYAKYFTYSERRPLYSKMDDLLHFIVVLAAGFCILQIFNWNSGSIIVGVVGARNYLLYLPLMYITRDLFRNQEELAHFLRYYLLLSIPMFILAMVQNAMPANHWINIYAGTEMGVSHGYIGDAVRVTGTFSYIAGYASYLLTSATLIIPLLIVRHPFVWRVLFFVIMLSIVAGIMMTGSRGPMIGLTIFIIGYFIFNKAIYQLGLYSRLAIPVALCFLGLSLWFSPLLWAYIGRFGTGNDLGERVYAMLLYPFNFMQYSGLIGFGVGTTYQAVDFLRNFMSLPPGTTIPIFYESEPERVMLELGPIGFAIWYSLRLRITYCLWKVYHQLTIPLFRELALTAFLLHLIAFPGQVVFQVTFLFYYWFTAGFIVLLPQLELLELQRRASQQAAEKIT